MIKRVVVMDLLPDTEGQFLDIFDTVKKQIRGSEGCLGLEVLRSGDDGHISVWTISLWENENALDVYRSSSLFKQTWSAVKPLFSGKAKAWTLTSIEVIA
ncbi:MAG TPA: antibiotic biosynthesis monooxygenase family protein [Saprospiraceae bacterium]